MSVARGDAFEENDDALLGTGVRQRCDLLTCLEQRLNPFDSTIIIDLFCAPG